MFLYLTNKQNLKNSFFLRKKVLYPVVSKLHQKKIISENKVTQNILKNSKTIKFFQGKNFIRTLDVIQKLEGESLNNISNLKKSSFNSKFLLKSTNIGLCLAKELILGEDNNEQHFENQLQYVFLLKEIVNSIQNTTKTLMRAEQSLLVNNQLFITEQKQLTMFANYLGATLFNNPLYLGYSVANQKDYLQDLFIKNFEKVLIFRIYSILLQKNKNKSFFININSNINLFNAFIESSKNWNELNLPIGALKILNNNNQLIKKIKKVKYAIQRRTSDISIFTKKHFFINLYKKDNFVKNFIWKRSFNKQNSILSQNYHPLTSLREKYNYNRKKTALQLSYILTRLEEKINYYKENNHNSKADKLIILKNYILFTLSAKKNRVLEQNFVVSKKKRLLRLRKRLWASKLIKALQTTKINQRFPIFAHKLLKNIYRIRIERRFVAKHLLAIEKEQFNKLKKKQQKSREKTKNINDLSNALFFVNTKKTNIKKVFKSNTFLNNVPNLYKYTNRILFAKKTEQSNFFTNNKKTLGYKSLYKNKKSTNKKVLGYVYKQKAKLKKKAIELKRSWVEGKLVLGGNTLPFQQKKLILSSWIGKSVDLFFINALSMTKFAFKLERIKSPNNNPNRFLSVLDRDFINKYKYVGIYIKDLVRVALISMYFKNPGFLAKFISFLLAKLPRNRKETTFIRFLIKVIKTFGAERKEILGVRIKFKGRVNRWRRTKFIIGNRGTFPLQTMSERIEQGTAQAINRKGAVGIRIWLRYKNTFGTNFRIHMLKYMEYSRILYRRQLKRRLLLQ